MVLTTFTYVAVLGNPGFSGPGGKSMMKENQCQFSTGMGSSSPNRFLNCLQRDSELEEVDLVLIIRSFLFAPPMVYFSTLSR